MRERLSAARARLGTKSGAVGTTIAVFGFAWKLVDHLSNVEFVVEKLRLMGWLIALLSDHASTALILLGLGVVAWSALRPEPLRKPGPQRFKADEREGADVGLSAEPTVERMPIDQPTKTRKAIGQPKRIYVPKTPDEVTNLVKDLTSIRAADVATRYVGKWMRLAGPVTNVTKYSSWVNVQMHWGKNHAPVNLRFPLDRLNQVEHLGPKDFLAAEGQIESMQLLFAGTACLTLENCEVIQLASVPSACVWPSPGPKP